MLRCTAAGLIPLLASKQFADIADTLYQENRKHFNAIIQHKSYYILRTLPKRYARALLLPVLPAIKAAQLKNGLWRGKDGIKTTYDILAAVDHAQLAKDASLRSPLAALQDQHGEYALLIKRLLGAPLSSADTQALMEIKQSITGVQDEDGSFDHTVTGTVIHLERLLALGVSNADPVIQSGVNYLLSQRKSLLQGIHTDSTYSLSVPDVFTAENRHAEFLAAKAYRPEWLPSLVCFRTMAVIPNAVCLYLLVRLGLENDPGVAQALCSVYELYRKHGGLCATNIKKPYLQA